MSPLNSAEEMTKISVLYVRKDSIYKTLGVDCWDITRDARNYSGHNPIVAHPPCRAWGRLRAFAKPRPDEKELALHAIGLIRKYGGVLEHPAGSSLWKEQNLPLNGKTDPFGGFTISVNQFWFGHRAQKNTLLYICGCSRADIPPLPLRFEPVQFTVSSNFKKGHHHWRPSITKKEREETPLLFAEWLLLLASRCTSSPLHYY